MQKQTNKQGQILKTYFDFEKLFGSNGENWFPLPEWWLSKVFLVIFSIKYVLGEKNIHLVF